MSADGEITVEVSAEGTDEAAEQLAGDGETDTPTPGGGDDDGGLSQSLRRGGIVGAVASLLSGILDVLSPMLEILDAFIAPIAAVILRILQPVLDLVLTRLLPLWLSFIEDFGPKITEAMHFLMKPYGLMITILDMILSAIKDKIQDLKEGIRTKIQDSIRALKQLPGKLKTRIMEALPNVSLPGTGGGGGDGGGPVDTAVGAAQGAGQTIINIAGGVPAYIDEVTRSRRTDP